MIRHYLKLESIDNSPPEEETICFFLSEFMRLGTVNHEQITK
jgi:hypothetical protein